MDNTALWESCEDNEFAGNCSYTLLLTTMAGTGMQIVVPVSIHHRWDMLEDHLVENLPAVSHLDTFGCELILLDADTHQALSDPIQETLWVNSHFHLVVQECVSRGMTARNKFEGKSMRTTPKQSGSLPMPPEYFRPKLSPLSRTFAMSKLTLDFTRLTEKPGDIAIRCKWSSSLTLLWLWNMLLSKGVLR